jgi:hypothetical protein
LVEFALHRHKYTYLSDYNCDNVQIISFLYPDHLKNQLHQATLKDDLTWSQFKIIADSIVSSLKASQMQLYDAPPSGKFIPHFQPPVLPLSPPLKSGPTTTAASISSPPMVTHKVASTTSTTTTTGIPIVDIYQTIPANPA